MDKKLNPYKAGGPEIESWISAELFYRIVGADLPPGLDPEDPADGIYLKYEWDAEREGQQTRRARAIQEYWDHHLYAHTPEGGRIRQINCISGNTTDPLLRNQVTGECFGTNAHPWPEVDGFQTPVATTHYNAAGGCGTTGNGDCLDFVSGNYTSNANDRITFGTPLEYAEEIREQWNFDIDAVVLPFITSAWRNPERNEAAGTGAVMNSNHQWGAAVDIKPDPRSNSQFPTVYSPMPGQEDRAATTWCQFAESAYGVETNNTLETHVENASDGAPGSDILYTWRETSMIAACVAVVRGRIEDCLNDNIDQLVLCSPTHVHSAR